MLKKRPGRAPARRRPVFLWLVLLAVALLAAADLPLLGRFDVAAARKVSRRARHSLGAAAPVDAPRVDALIAHAEEVTARERSAPFWRRDDEAVAEAWGRAMVAAGEANAELRHRRRLEADGWTAVEPETAAAVARAREEARTPGLGRGEIMLAEQAEVALQSARRLAAAGDLAAAARAAHTAREQALEVHARWERLHRRFDDSAALSYWRRMVDETLADSRRRGVAVLVVDKLRRRLEVFERGRRVATFRVELGVQGLKRKLHAGDRATPEGRYRVVDVKTGAETRFYKALLLDYPNPEDRARWARERRRGNVPVGAGAGGLIEIHGDGGQGKDWTDGCLALTNEEMDRLFRYAELDTPVTIVGTVPGGGGSR